MKSLILYKSKWGSTKEYAEYIHSKVQNTDIFSIDGFDPSKLSEYDKVVIGSRVFTGNIQGVNFLQNNWYRLKDKKVYFFAVGLLAPEDESSKKGYEAIPQEIRNNIQFIKLPGKVDLTKLNFFEKLLFRMVKSQKGKSIPFENKFSLENTQQIIDFLNQ